MSASQASDSAAPSSKRPLEDPSSDAEAKRPALDKNEKATSNGTTPAGKATGQDSVMTTEESAQPTVTNGKSAENDAADTPDTDGGSAGASAAAVTTTAAPAAAGMTDIQPIQSSVNETGHAVQSGIPEKQDESSWLHVRSIIASQEAATLIGKGGENVTQIRKISGAKCTVSDYSRGAIERVLTVSGGVDAVGKAFGLIIRTLNNESLDEPSNSDSKVYPLRLLIPHILVGAIIGQKGQRIREIQEASGARLNASESCLPLSTERSLVVLGVADAVHIATYYISQTLVEQLKERFGGPAASNYATRSGGPAGVIPGGMQVIPYQPMPAGGQWGHPDTYNRTMPQAARPVAQPQYGAQYQQPMHPQAAPQLHAQTPLHYQAQPRHGYTGAGPQAPSPYGQQPGMGPQPPQQQPPVMQQGAMGLPGQPLTQQIYIPNDMVGAIIGKGGAKINEIRQLSGSVIKINEPQDNSNERLVTITGTQECNQMALYMLYQRLESEKHRI